MSLPLIIGVGNPFRGDDAAGLLAARALARAPISEAVEICESDGSALALLELWRNREQVVVIDAVLAASNAIGSVLVLDGLTEALPAEPPGTSTHAFGLQAAIDLSRAIGALPHRLTIIGIVGKNFATGHDVSSEVADAAESFRNGLPLGLNGFTARL